MRRRILTFLSLWLAFCVYGQEGLTVLTGRVVSRHDGRALPHVSVSAPDERVSTVTNEDGAFLLKVPVRPTHITVSHLGYHSQCVSIGNKTEGLKIKMVPSAIMLDDVVVSANDPREVVWAAISKIPENYQAVPALMHCFYRETARKGGRFIAVSEAVTDMYKTAYDRRTTYGDAVSIVKGRRLLSTRAKDTLGVKLMGGPVIPIVLDAVKNAELLLNEEELGLYDLTSETPERIGDRPQYVISLKPHYSVARPLFYGRLYIDQQTLAFTRVELELDMADRLKATDYMLVKKPHGLRFSPRSLTTVINYRTSDEDHLTRISYVRNEMCFKCDWKRLLFSSAYTVVSEMVVTEQVPADSVRRIKGRDSFGLRDYFYDQAEFFDDPDFWGAYNIIEPTESLEHAINKLKKKR